MLLTWTYPKGQWTEGKVTLDTITGRQALFQHRRELLRELLPVLLSNLVLEAVQDLRKEKVC